MHNLFHWFITICPQVGMIINIKKNDLLLLIFFCLLSLKKWVDGGVVAWLAAAFLLPEGL